MNNKIFNAAFILLLPILVNAQDIELMPFSCNQLRTIHSFALSEKTEYHIQLEKEIAPNLWTSVSREVTSASSFIFSDMENGTYRATILETAGWVDNTEIRNHISNVIEIDCSKDKSGLEQFFKVFPNPAKSTLTLTCNEHLLKDGELYFEIWSSDGMMVKNGRVESDNLKMDVSTLNTNQYIIVLRKKEKYLTSQKIIINNK